MNYEALVAALGPDAVAAADGYRLAVLAEAERRGLRLVDDAPSRAASISSTDRVAADPIDIRLAFIHSRRRPGLAGTTLRWGPAHGWSLSHRTASGPLCFYAGPGATPLGLVPTPPQVLDWATDDSRGAAAPPVGVELHDDPAAIHRLLDFVDPQPRSADPQAGPASAGPSHGSSPSLHDGPVDATSRFVLASAARSPRCSRY